MSNDSSSSLTARARQLVVLELKKQALAAKQEGNVSVALELLKQSKAIEALEVSKLSVVGVVDNDVNDEDNSNDDTLLPSLYWKKLAVLYKQEGDLELAKRALIRGKQREQEEIKEKQQQEEKQDTATTGNSESSESPPTTRNTEETIEPDVSPEEEEDLLKDFNKSSGDNHMDSSNDQIASTPTFSLDEMIDEEMMTEFCLGGMPVPSQEEYAAKILDCKRKALQLKQRGDIPQATRHLRCSKQLEKVQSVLRGLSEQDGSAFNGNAEDVDAWLQTLTAEESELLGELMLQQQSEEDGAATDMDVLKDENQETLTPEELETMGDADILDFVEMMGQSSLPTVEQLREQAEQHQKQALEYKQAGNLDMAKSSLLDSKRSKAQAERMVLIYERIAASSDAGSSSSRPAAKEVSLEDLEALVNATTSTRNNVKAKESNTQKPQPPQDPWMSKPSAEIKQEVIRLKNNKDVKEATRLLQIFKQVLQKEQQIAEAEKCQKLLATIQKRLDVCETQIRLWQFYMWFVDPKLGSQQYKEWTEFAGYCETAMREIKTNGSNAVTMSARPDDDATSKLFLLQNDVVELVERGTNAAAAIKTADNSSSSPEEKFALEVAVMGIFNMHQNEKLNKLLGKKVKETGDTRSDYCPNLRIDAKVHLPLNPDNPSQPVHLDFSPTSSYKSGESYQYTFEPSHECSRRQLDLPEKDSKQAKTLLRRFETKTLQFSVYYTHRQYETKREATKTSWFFGRTTQTDVELESSSEKDILLGKTSIELRQLLSRKCIAGDFPLTAVNAKDIGGTIRVSIRTTAILDVNCFTGILDGSLPVLEAYKNGILFRFQSA